MSLRMEEMVSKGERIYHQKILKSPSAKKKGYFAAIEVKSGRYFLGKNPLQAIEKAESQFPKAKFHLVRIGYRAASSLKKRLSL